MAKSSHVFQMRRPDIPVNSISRYIRSFARSSSTFFVGSPTPTNLPAALTHFSPFLMAAPDPVMSIAASAPMLFVKCMTSAMTSLSALLTNTSAPIARARLLFSSRRSQAITAVAPIVLQALIAASPIGPHPLTSTILPFGSAASAPCTPAPIGSSRHACSNEISSSSRNVLLALIFMYSAKAPSSVTPSSLMLLQI